MEPVDARLLPVETAESGVVSDEVGLLARLKRRLCPLGRSVRLGARGRCRPRARPPTTGNS